MPDSVYPYQPGGYQPPPSPIVHAITDVQPTTDLIPATSSTVPVATPATGTGPRRGPSPFVRALPAAAAMVPFGVGRLWSLHGGHSISAFAVGGLATVGFGLAFANRSEPATALWLTAAAGMVAEFAIDAYAPEIFLPGGLAALTLVGTYTAVARVWRKAARAAAKHAERRELQALDAATTIQVEQIRAHRDISIAAIQAGAQVRTAELTATALTAITAAPASPYPLLELSPQARAMLERSPDLGLDRAALEPGREHDAA